jgi:hypothetical protein
MAVLHSAEALGMSMVAESPRRRRWRRVQELERDSIQLQQAGQARLLAVRPAVDEDEAIRLAAGALDLQLATWAGLASRHPRRQKGVQQQSLVPLPPRLQEWLQAIR